MEKASLMSKDTQLSFQMWCFSELIEFKALSNALLSLLILTSPLEYYWNSHNKYGNIGKRKKRQIYQTC